MDEIQRCDHCDNGYDPGDSYCRFCGAFVGEPPGSIAEVTEKIRWAICCGRDHCNASEHSADHDISDDGYAEKYGCESPEIAQMAGRCMRVISAIVRRADEENLALARREIAAGAKWAADYERAHGPFQPDPAMPDFMVPF